MSLATFFLNSGMDVRADAVKPLLERLDAAELVALAKFLALGGDPPVVAAASDVSGEWEPKLPIHLRADVLKETVSVRTRLRRRKQMSGGAPRSERRDLEAVRLLHCK